MPVLDSFGAYISTDGDISASATAALTAAATAFVMDQMFGSAVGNEVDPAADPGAIAARDGAKDSVLGNSLTKNTTKLNSTSGLSAESAALKNSNLAGSQVVNAATEGVKTLDNMFVFSAHFNSQPLMEALIAGSISPLAGLKMSHEVLKDKGIDINRGKVSRGIRNTVFRYTGAVEAFAQARNLLAVTLVVADVGFGVTGKLTLGMGAGARIAVQGPRATFEAAKIATNSIKQAFKNLIGRQRVVESTMEIIGWING